MGIIAKKMALQQIFTVSIIQILFMWCRGYFKDLFELHIKKKYSDILAENKKKSWLLVEYGLKMGK